MAVHDFPRSLRRVAWPPIVLALALALPASAGNFRLISSSTDGGGGHAQGARFRLEGSAGQRDAGWLQGQRYTLQGGFWPTTADTASNDTLFADSFED